MRDGEVYFFGDARLQPGPGAGHHLWAAIDGHVGWASPEARSRLPWTLIELDSRLAGDPTMTDPRRRGHWARDDQPEGIVRLHHRAGWTAISFWDRSGDGRHGSNSTFIAAGEHSAWEMVELFQQAFPAIWERITRRFELVLPVEASKPEPAPRLRIEVPAIRVAPEPAGERLEIGDVAEAEEPTEAAPRRLAVGGERRTG